MQIDKQMCRRWKDFLNLAKDISLIISFLRLDRIRKYIYSMDRRKSRVWSFESPISAQTYSSYFIRVFLKRKRTKSCEKNITPLYLIFIYIYIFYDTTRILQFFSVSNFPNEDIQSPFFFKTDDRSEKEKKNLPPPRNISNNKEDKEAFEVLNTIFRITSPDWTSVDRAITSPWSIATPWDVHEIID